MARVCPHCGCALPAVADGFCRECRSDIDEPPAVPATPGQQRAALEEGTASTFLAFGWLALAGSAFAAFILPRGDAVLSVVFFLLGGGALLGEASRRSARARKLRRAEAEESKPAEPSDTADGGA